MKPLPMLLLCSLASTPLSAHADFTYQETTQITGGSVVGMMKMVGVFSKQARQASDPIVSTVMVRGNKMVRVDKDTSEIIDLDDETITQIDHVKKQYTTMTFAQMRQQMEAAMAKAKAEQAKHPATVPDSNPQVDVKFSVKVRNTDASRDVAGLIAKESIMSMTMDATDQKSGQTGALAITNDMYLTPDIPGYQEVRDFYKRFAVKMGTAMSGAVSSQVMALMQQPAAGKGMAEMVKEMSKLKGVPVLQIMRMGTTVDGLALPAASEAALPTGPPPPTAGEIARSAVMSSLPFGGFGRKKKQEEPPASAVSGPVAGAVLIESTTQVSQFSKASIDSSQFTPPSGYKRVEAKSFE